MTQKLPGWVVVFLFAETNTPAMMHYRSKKLALEWVAVIGKEPGSTIIAVCPASDLAKLGTRKERE